jgi:hypothetical protein
MRRLIRKGFLAITMACALGAAAQEPGEQAGRHGQFAGMQRVSGEVTAVSGDAITIKAEDGTVYQVTTTANTRMMKAGGVPFKVADLKAGDGLMAMGNMDEAKKTLHAAMVGMTDAETLKKMRENLGKTFISGKVVSIDADNLKMTIQRPDGVAQTIGFDEGTSFKRGGRGMRGGMGAGAAPAGATEGGESITLADIKVGDNVTGPGTVKGGVVIPGQLNVAAPHVHGAGGKGEGTPAPANPQP